MNPNPAIEYAVYLPLKDAYMVSLDSVAVWPTLTMAENAAPQTEPYEIHCRYNATITPWQPAAPHNPAPLLNMFGCLGEASKTAFCGRCSNVLVKADDGWQHYRATQATA